MQYYLDNIDQSNKPLGLSPGKRQYENYNDLKEALDILRQEAMGTNTSISIIVSINIDPDHTELTVCANCGLQLGSNLYCPRCSYDIDYEKDTNEICSTEEKNNDDDYNLGLGA